MEYHPLPQPEEIEVRVREDAMGAYFMMFATTAMGLPLPFLNLVAWTIVNFAKDHDFTSFYWGYLVMCAVAALIYLIFSLVGAVKARKGMFYYFVFFGKVAYHQVCRI